MSLGTSSAEFEGGVEERAFLALVDRHHRCMQRLARALLPAYAEDVVHDAWRRFLATCRSLPEGAVDSSVFRAVVASARERARGAGAALELATAPEPSVAPERFQPPGERYGDNWASPPRSWDEERLAGDGIAAALGRAVERLPSGEQAAYLLRDAAGMSAPQVCELLGLSEGEERALVHRARSKLRAAVEAELSAGGGGA